MQEIRTASSVLSINEIRERYYHLPPVEWGSLPAGMKSGDNVGAQYIAPSEPDDTSTGNDDTPAVKSTPDDALTELAQWERFALKRLHKPGGRPFEVRATPGEIAFEVNAGLMAAKTKSDAEAVFENARQLILEKTA